MADQATMTSTDGVGMGPDRDPGQAPPRGTSGSGTTRPGGTTGADPGVDEMGVPVPSVDTPNPRGGTLSTAVEDLTEPGEDANFPDPAKPISAS
jgi:hypothetical protein